MEIIKDKKNGLMLTIFFCSTKRHTNIEASFLSWKALLRKKDKNKITEMSIQQPELF